MQAYIMKELVEIELEDRGLQNTGGDFGRCSLT